MAQYQVWIEGGPDSDYRKQLKKFPTEAEAYAYQAGYEQAAMSFGGVSFRDQEWFCTQDHRNFRLFIHEEE